MAITVTPPTSAKVTQPYGVQWASKNSDLFADYWKELNELYGALIGVRSIYAAAGRKVYSPNALIKVMEKTSKVPILTLGSAVGAGAAGATITFTLDADNYDTDGHGPLQAYQTFFIPDAYLANNTPREYIVTSVSGTDADAIYTAMPLNKAGTNVTATQITSEVPVGTNLALGSSAYAFGTGQPSGKTDSPTSVSFSHRNMKESRDLEGGQVAQFFEQISGLEGGNKPLFNEMIMSAEFDLDLQEEKAFAFGEWADNTSLTQTTGLSQTNSIVSGAGLFPWADKRAQKLEYGGDFSVNDLYDVRPLQHSQGVVATSSVFGVGPDLFVQLEKAGLQWIQQYSGGTDLFDKGAKTLGIPVKAINVSGQTFMVVEWQSLADPTGMGMYQSGDYIFNYAKSGLVIPDATIAVSEFNGKQNVRIPNIQISYINHNGENRERMMGYEVGMNGLGIGGGQVSSGYDQIKVHLSTSMGFVGVGLNQVVYMLPE